MNFDSIKKAKPAKDGLVVLAVMIKVLFKKLTKEHMHMSDSQRFIDSLNIILRLFGEHFIHIETSPLPVMGGKI